MNLAFQIAKHLNVIVVSESLGEIAAYYHKIENQKIIHVDESQTEWEKAFAVRFLLCSALSDSDDFRAILKNELRLFNLNVHLEQSGTPENPDKHDVFNPCSRCS